MILLLTKTEMIPNYKCCDYDDAKCAWLMRTDMIML